MLKIHTMSVSYLAWPVSDIDRMNTSKNKDINYVNVFYHGGPVLHTVRESLRTDDVIDTHDVNLSPGGSFRHIVRDSSRTNYVQDIHNVNILPGGFVSSDR